MKELFNSVAIGVPAQQYHIRCHVSVERQVPVMTEFAVRLIYLTENIKFEVFRDYFKIETHEANELVSMLQSEGLVQDVDGVLSLTTYALARFVASDDGIPRFTKIEERQSHPVFNLLTFSPIKKLRSDLYWDNTLELYWEGSRATTKETTLNASEAFHHHFHEIERLDKEVENKRAYSVYKIEGISTGKRFNIPVPMNFYIDMDGGIEYKIEDDSVLPEDLKSKIIQLTADRVGAMTAHVDYFSDFQSIFKDSLFEEYMEDASGIRKTSTLTLNKHSEERNFSFSKFVREVHAEGGGKVYDAGQSRALLGAPYLAKNQALLLEFLDEGLQQSRKSSDLVNLKEVYWLIPDSELWGRTEMTKDFTDGMQKIIYTELGRAVKLVAIVCSQTREKEDALIRKARVLLSGGFDEVIFGTRKRNAEKAEVILIPSVMTCAMYQWKTPTSDFLTVPIGFASNLSEKLECSQSLISDSIQEATTRAAWDSREGIDRNRISLSTK